MALAEHESPDAQRFAAWVRDYGPAVRGYLLAMTGKAADAEDLAQDVFCRAWQARQQYREQGQARAFLFRIADRLACDQHRRKRETTLSTLAYETELQGAEEGPAESAQRREAAERLNGAMQQLSPAQRRVLFLRYYGQLSFQEIADTIGCPLNTALSHCRRALETLRQQLVEFLP